MTLPIHIAIMQRREQLGIGREEFANRIGLSESEYRDVEFYPNELRMVIPIKNVRLLAATLGIELGALLGTGSLEERPRTNKPRPALLAEARDRLGVSTKKMADEIGFEEVFVRRIESDDETLDTYPYEVFKIVADYLKLDPRDLLSS